MDAARAYTLATAAGLLPAGVAGDEDPRPSPRRWAGAPERSKRTGNRGFKPHHAASGHRIDFGGAASPVSSSPGSGDGRRKVAANAHAAAQLDFCEALGLPAG